MFLLNIIKNLFFFNILKSHGPQHGFTGTGLDLPLLQWLNKYTFPYESRFSNLEYAEKIYKKSVRKLHCLSVL